jgi:hypothetical protein
MENVMVNWQTCYRVVDDAKAVWCDGLTDTDGNEYPFDVQDRGVRLQSVVSYFDDERIVESESELSDSLTDSSGSLTISARATQLLHQLTLHEGIEEYPTDILNKRGEMLARWSTFSSQHIYDALDHERSVLESFSGSNTVAKVHSWSFDTRKLPDVDLFLSPPLTWIASEQMRKVFRQQKIKGLRFVPLWCAKKGPVPQKEIEDSFEIDLRNTQVRDEGLPNLRHAINLQNLNAQGTHLSDSGVCHLSHLPRLRVLKLGDTAVGDKTLEVFCNAPSISVLSLPRTNVTDSGLLHLGKYPRLRIVDLEGTSVTDSGVESLCRIKKLQRVNIRDTAVSKAGVKRLEDVFPKCEIIS